VCLFAPASDRSVLAMPTFLELPLPCLPQDQTHAINAAPLVCVTICRGFRHSDQIISPNTAGQIDSGFSPRSPAGAGADAAIRPSAAIALHSLTDAGFTDINAAVVKLKKDVPDVASFARGLVFGSPLIDQVRARKGVAPDQRPDTCTKSFCWGCWGFNSQGFTWPFVELTHHLFRWACDDTDNRLSSEITEYTPSFHLR
jgi:hypothetical protein